MFHRSILLNKNYSQMVLLYTQGPLVSTPFRGLGPDGTPGWSRRSDVCRPRGEFVSIVVVWPVSSSRSEAKVGNGEAEGALWHAVKGGH